MTPAVPGHRVVGRPEPSVGRNFQPAGRPPAPWSRLLGHRTLGMMRADLAARTCIPGDDPSLLSFPKGWCGSESTEQGRKIMPHSFKGAFTLIAASVVSVVVLPVSMAGAASVPSIGLSTARPAVALPNSDIEKSGSTSVYDPTALSVGWSAPASSKEPACTSTIFEATITNTTKKTQKVTYEKKVIGKIPKGDEIGLCFYGSGTSTLVVGLKKSASTLTITVT